MNHDIVITSNNPGRMTVSNLFLSHSLPTSPTSEPQISKNLQYVTLTQVCISASVHVCPIVFKYQQPDDNSDTPQSIRMYIHVVALMYGLFISDPRAAYTGSPAVLVSESY